MADDQEANIIQEHPIKDGLDAFRTSFNSVCDARGLSCTPDAINYLTPKDIQNSIVNLLFALRNLSASSILPSKTSHESLQDDLLRSISAVASNSFDSSRIWPLLDAILARKSDSDIWHHAYSAVTEITPPPREIASSFLQTPWRHNTGSFANSSEYRKDVDAVLKSELGSLYVGLTGFRSTFFSDTDDLQKASNAVFKRCTEGNNALFANGWKGWPEDANQDGVLSWFADITEKLAAFSEDYNGVSTNSRRPLAQPNMPIEGSTADRKLDIGFVSNSKAGKNTRCHWSQILIPGELKSNPSADTTSKAWLDLGRYAREVLAAQDTRRFVLGFTICGTFMRIWAFDRLGGVASERFDINKDGLQFVSTILGFLWMKEEELGFDPTITIKDNQRFIEIEQNGQTKRLIIDKVMKRSPCIAGRATTCWKAHREEEPGIPLVIKDSWQYVERPEEGELLQEAAKRGVVNVARYYYHETVRIRGEIDDIQENVRGGLDITTASNYRPETLASSTSTNVADASQRAGVKRSLSQSGASLPPRKRLSRSSSTKTLPNRVHRRVVLRDYGVPIYKASTRQALLATLEGCIAGHQSLLEAGILHRDISVNNLMINEDKENPSWPSFLIDLDLAIKEQRDIASGAHGKTGTKAFMAIGALMGEQHSFMHDLESFFWVIFWICIHYDGPTTARIVPRFDQWNYLDTDVLAGVKKGEIIDEKDFVSSVNEHFTAQCKPLISCVNKLRTVVFPNGKRWENEDKGLYNRMKEILQDAQRDL